MEFLGVGRLFIYLFIFLGGVWGLVLGALVWMRFMITGIDMIV